MAKQVENRVVEMEFKNKDFEKAVSVTMKSLEELNQKIDDLNKINTDGFEKIEKAANGLKFNTLFDNIDRINDRLTTLGGKFISRIQDEIVSIGVNAFTSVTNSLNRAYDSVTSTIVNKGKTRAQNLAQAKFQLEALGVEWNKVYNDMDYAVSGTAYGIDEAARAASQFAASNVALGDDMKAALRGISGVAAMTGRSYTEISQIFTTVAGTGRAMNGELNRIAERGLNAKKAIADFINETNYFGDGLKVTQEQIYDFAKDGEISFDLFSKAMDSAFGEHATKANDLFTGALDNTKAALGRIGERFATPIYEDLRQILVALIPVINDFKKSLDPVVNSVTGVTGSIKKMIVDGLEKIHGAFLNENSFTIELFGRIIDAKALLLDFLTTAGDLIKGISYGLNSEMFLNIMWNVVGVLKAVKGGITDVFGTLEKKDIITLFSKITYLTKKLMLSEETLEKIRSIVGGIAAIFDMVYKTIYSLWHAAIVPMMYSISPVLGSILDGTADIGEALKKLNENYNPFSEMQHFFELLRRHINPFVGELKKIFASIKDFFVSITGIHDVQSFFEQMDKLSKDLHIADIFYTIAGAIVLAIDKLKTFVDLLNAEEVKAYMKNLVEQNTILTWIKDKYTAIKTTLNDLFSHKITLSQALGLDKLKEQFEWLNPVIETFKEHYKSIFEAYEGEEGKEGLPFIQQFGDKLKQAILNLDFEDIFGIIGAAFYTYFGHKTLEIKTYLAKQVGTFVDTFNKLADGVNMSLVKMSKETNAEKILKISAGIALLAASVLMIGKMNQSEIIQGLAGLLAITVMIGALVAALAKVLKSTSTLENKYNLREKGVKSKDRKKTTGRGKKRSVVERLFETVEERFSAGTETVTKAMSDLSAVPALILSLGATIFLIVGAMAKLAKASDNPAILGIAFGAVALTMYLLSQMIQEIMEFASGMKEDLDENKIMAVGKMILLAGLAIKLIASSIAELTVVSSFGNEMALVASWAVITLILAEVAGIAYELTKFVDKLGEGAERKMLAAGGIMMMMAVAIQMLTIPIAALAALMSIPGVGLVNVVDAAAVVGLLAILMAALAAALAKLTQNAGVANLVAGAASMILMGVALNAMILPIAAITALASVNMGALDTAIQVVLTLTLVMGLIVALFGIIGGGTKGAGAAAFLAGAAAMWIIAKGMQQVALALAGLTAMEALFPGGIEALFKDIKAGVDTMADIKTIVVLGILAAVLTALGVAVVLLGTGVLEFGAGFKFIAQGILAIVGALALLQAIDFEAVGQNLVNGGAAFIKGMVEVIQGGITDIEEGLLALIGAVCSTIVGSSGMVAEAAIKLLTDVIVALDNHAEELGWNLGLALAKLILYAAAGIFAAGYDFIGMAFGLQKGQGMTTLLKHRLFDDAQDDLTVEEATKMTKDTGEKLGKSLVGNVVGSFAQIWDDEGKSLISKIMESKNKIFNSGWDIGGFATAAVTGNLAAYASTKASKGFLSSILKLNKEDEEEIKDAVAPAGDAAADGITESLESKENVEKVSEATENLTANALSEDKKNAIKDKFKEYGLEIGDEFFDGEFASADIVNGESLNSKELSEYIEKPFGSEDLMKKYYEDGYGNMDSLFNGMFDAADSASPSKRSKKLGGYIDEGLALGFGESGLGEKAATGEVEGIFSILETLTGASDSMSKNSVLDPIKQTIANLADMASSDMEITPTITPVLDMSNVSAGFASLSSMFSSDRSIALASEISDLNTANRALSYQIQNDKSVGVDNGFMSLHNDILRLGDAIMNMDMVMDTGEVVGVLANPMDRTLGKKVIQVQRGGARRS